VTIAITIVTGEELHDLLVVACDGFFSALAHTHLEHKLLSLR
jgi:2-polyprenyl-6-methoxyphenol hydroxylase-like FAD-dependent oxidoreductase